MKQYNFLFASLLEASFYWKNRPSCIERLSSSIGGIISPAARVLSAVAGHINGVVAGDNNAENAQRA